MSVLSSPATITGTIHSDYILGTPAAGLDSTLAGGAGNDLIFGDYTPFLIAGQVSGATHTAAFDMTGAGGLSLWTVQENPFITNSTVDPHASAVIEATGSYQWFRFDVVAGQKLTVDIDHGFNGLSSSFDSRVTLFASDGVTQVATNDNRPLVDPGSVDVKDSFLAWTATTAGTYYVRISTVAGAAIPSGNSYVANFSLSGQAYNTVNGESGNDVLNGGAGNDILFGGAGNDVVSGAGDVDTLYGGSGNDVLNGGSGVDSIFGGSGDDIIRFLGNDLGDNINGDSGNDTLDLSGRSDGLGFTVDLDLGTAQFTNNPHGPDGIYRVRSVEHVIGTEYDDNITGSDQINRLLGGSGNDTISGGEGVDTLNGGVGNDTLIGGNGNDRYFVDSAADVIVETTTGGTVDTVITTVTYALGAGVDVEILKTADAAGTSNIFLTGNEFSQQIIGNAGNNRLASSIGDADVLTGKDGNDTYWLSNAGDRVVEVVGGGIDIVQAAVSYKLAAAAEIELLATNDVAGTSSVNLTGNKYAQGLNGNNGANRLDGGFGADTMTGNGGADVFVFSTSARNGNIDTITDFEHGTDKIELENAVFSRLAAGPLAADAFEIVTESAATLATTRIMYDSDSGDLLFDIDGTGANTPLVFAHLSAGLTLTADDFIIV